MSEAYSSLSTEELKRQLRELESAAAPVKTSSYSTGNLGNMSKEELIAELGADAPASPVDEELPTPTQAGLNTAYESLSNVVGQGLLMGGGDEISAGVKSVFGDKTYDEYMQESQAKRKQFSADHPEAAIGGTIAGAVLNPVDKAVKGGRLVKALAETAKGGIYGGLSADQDNRTDGIVEGAAFSGGISAAGNLGRIALESAAAQRVKKSMYDEAGNFIPLNLSDDGALGALYKTIVSKAYGGDEVGKQSRKVIKAQQRRVDDLKHLEDLGIKGQKQRIQAQIDENFDVNRAQKAQASAKSAQTNAQNVKQVAIDTAEADANAIANASRAGRAFIRRNFADSVPDNWPNRNTIVSTAGDSPTKALDMMKKEWREHGFKEVKRATFRIDSEKLRKQVDRAVAKFGMVDIEKSVDGAFSILPKKLGNVSGKNLMDARTSLRQTARRMVDEGASATDTRALHEAADKIDAEIMRQLPNKAARDAFKAELANYSSFVNTRRAVGESIISSGGKFNATDLLKAQKRSGGQLWETGSVRGQGTALAMKEAEENAVTGLSRSKDAIKERSAAAKEVEKVRLADQISDIDNQGKAKTRALKKAMADSDTLAANVDPNVQKGLARAKSRLDGYKEGATARSGGPVEQGLSTGILGAVSAGTGSTAAVLLTGAGLAKNLSKPEVQKALAGRTELQKNLRKLLRGYDKGQLKEFNAAVSPAIKQGLIQQGILSAD